MNRIDVKIIIIFALAISTLATITYLKVNSETGHQDAVSSKTSPKEEVLLQDDLYMSNTIYNINSTGQNSSRNLATVPAYPIWNNDYRNGLFWIPTIIDKTYSSASTRLIIHCLKNLETRSQVIKFDLMKYHSTTNDIKPYIHIRNDPGGCWSFLGRSKSAASREGQFIVLGEENCMNSATIQHEMMHALGFGHEQARPDRDQYVMIMWNNIISTSYRQFDKVSGIDSLGTPYDLDSIMHYQAYDWSNGNGPSIIPRHGRAIGKKKFASPIDILQIRLMYQCIDGPRHWNAYRMNPCSAKCQCWEGRQGCKGRNSFCKGNLICHFNVCKQPPTTISLPVPSPPKSPSQPTPKITRQIVKRRISGLRYYLVSGAMFDIQAKSTPIYIQNLIFKGLGSENNAENVNVDIFTKVNSHLQWVSSSSSSSWRWVGSTILRDNGTDNAQSFPSNTFSAPITINPWEKQAFYIQVKNCGSNCSKLRVWEGSNYALESNAYLEDSHVRMLEGCVLVDRFDNQWGNCRNTKGGKSFTFWGGIQYNS